MILASISFIVGVCIGAWLIEGFYKDAIREDRAVLISGKIYKFTEVKDKS